MRAYVLYTTLIPWSSRPSCCKVSCRFHLPPGIWTDALFRYLKSWLWNNVNTPRRPLFFFKLRASLRFQDTASFTCDSYVRELNIFIWFDTWNINCEVEKCLMLQHQNTWLIKRHFKITNSDNFSFFDAWILLVINRSETVKCMDGPARKE